MKLTRRHILALPLPIPTLMTACSHPAPSTAVPAVPVATVRHGRLERLPALASRHVDARPVDVWLPPGYDSRRPHAVLYMHDGQMLFDPSTTWNKQAWELDRMAAPLLARGALSDFIVVAPWNNGKLRFAEYFPEAWVAHLDATWRDTLAERALLGPPRSGREREHTFLAGSSMGGLISRYGLCEHPRVFGGAACLSTHWIGGYERNDVVPAAALRYLRDKLPTPDSVRIWMDRGDQDLDALYDRAQARVDALMADKGFRAPRFVSKVFAGTGHNERAWRDRLPEVLGFLLAA